MNSAVHPQPSLYIYQLSDIEGQTSKTADAPINNGKTAVRNSSLEADGTKSEEINAEEEAQRARQRERQYTRSVGEETHKMVIWPLKGALELYHFRLV